MIGIVLVTHGQLAKEFRHAVEHVVGPQDGFETVSIGADDDMEQRRRDILAAIKRAGLNPEDIDYVNAHGTSTPLGDEIELGAVKRVFGDHAYSLSMSSTKSAIGHLLGAAGSVEAVFSILALRDGVVPPTLNLENPSPGCDIDLVPDTAKERPVAHALTNSFGFGGTNVSLVLKGSG